MAEESPRVAFGGRLLMIGCGGIGRGPAAPVKHIDITPDRILVVTADSRGREVADEAGVAFREVVITRDNYRDVLDPLVEAGDFILNLSVEVSSLALVRFAKEKGALYLDTCIEPWAGAYTDTTLSPSQRSNYMLREGALALKRELGPRPTAVIAQGANPGMVSQLVKEAALNLARDLGKPADIPADREDGRGSCRSWGQGDPHRRTRHASLRGAQEARRVRQHMVDRRFHQRRQPAGRTRLGNPRDGVAAGRRASSKAATPRST